MRDQVAVQSTAVSKVGSELWDYSFRYRPVIDRAIEPARRTASYSYAVE